MSDLSLQLAKWLFKKKPGLLESRDDDTADALNAVAATLGGLLATVIILSGEEVYNQTLRVLFSTADEVARRTARSTLLKTANASAKRKPM